MTESALESRARRAAKRAGLIATKSRWRKYSIDNHGEFMLLDAQEGFPVGGFRWDLTASEVLEFVEEYDQ